MKAWNHQLLLIIVVMFSSSLFAAEQAKTRQDSIDETMVRLATNAVMEVYSDAERRMVLDASIPDDALYATVVNWVREYLKNNPPKLENQKQVTMFRESLKGKMRLTPENILAYRKQEMNAAKQRNIRAEEQRTIARAAESEKNRQAEIDAALIKTMYDGGSVSSDEKLNLLVDKVLSLTTQMQELKKENESLRNQIDVLAEKIGERPFVYATASGSYDNTIEGRLRKVSDMQKKIVDFLIRETKDAYMFLR